MLWRLAEDFAFRSFSALSADSQRGTTIAPMLDYNAAIRKLVLHLDNRTTGAPGLRANRSAAVVAHFLPVALARVDGKIESVLSGGGCKQSQKAQRKARRQQKSRHVEAPNPKRSTGYFSGIIDGPKHARKRLERPPTRGKCCTPNAAGCLPQLVHS